MFGKQNGNERMRGNQSRSAMARNRSNGSARSGVNRGSTERNHRPCVETGMGIPVEFGPWFRTWRTEGRQSITTVNVGTR